MNRDIRPVRYLIETGRYSEARVLLHETLHPGVAVYLERLQAAEDHHDIDDDKPRALPWILGCALLGVVPVLLVKGLHLVLLALFGGAGAVIGFVIVALIARRNRRDVHPNILPRSRSYRL